jgi:hypothetical protein
LGAIPSANESGLDLVKDSLAVGTDQSELVAKFLYLAVERIQAVSPAAMQQDQWQPFAFIAIEDLYRTNAGNKRGR